MTKLSAFVTTFNNARTLDACLRSVSWADEIVLLDSFSTDQTIEIAERYDCTILQHSFMGYGKQKQLAMEKTRHRWVLLLDADEMLSAEAEAEIQTILARAPAADGYEMARREQVFWRMANPHVRMNFYLRLFDKSKARFSDIPIHAAPELDGKVARLHAVFYHFGEWNVHTKVEKINAYSTGLVDHKYARKRRMSPFIMLLYPPWFFLRSFIFKRGFLNGWAGFIASVTGAFYAFLRYAKLYERIQAERHPEPLMPPEPPAATARDEPP